MDTVAVRDRADELPKEPGVYQFRDGDTALYVGKAVDLRDRVRSYTDPRGQRIGRMVHEASSIEVAVTDTETQALLLEANLIKRLQPRYNVRLTDDKSYPLVQVTNHEFPRIEVTRDPEEGAAVHGPFTDKSRVDAVVKALREIYGIRGCSNHKFANRDRPCLDHDLGLCTAPCTGFIDHVDYVNDVGSVRRFLDGATGVLSDPLRRQMQRAADRQQFERAAHLRDKIDAVESFHGGGGDAVQIRDERRTMDVLGSVVEGREAVVARLHADSGKLIDRERHTLDTPDHATVADVLAAFIPQFYAERVLPDVFVLSDHPEDDELSSWLEAEGVTMSVPGTGRESRLVDLALKNARRAIGRQNEGAVLGEALGFDTISRIEGVDISHSHGKSVVGSNVVFVDGNPDKSGYRRKRLTDQNDDYRNMYDLMLWRASRGVEGRDDRPAPDLMLIDGGESQLSAARDAISAVGWEVPVVALAKGEETVVTPTGHFNWPSNAPQLHLLQRVRDEAHRFAVQYHKTLRDNVDTVLETIEGVGPERRRKLLRRFGSVQGVRAASVDELKDIPGIGRETAETIKQSL